MHEHLKTILESEEFFKLLTTGLKNELDFGSLSSHELQQTSAFKEQGCTTDEDLISHWIAAYKESLTTPDLKYCKSKVKSFREAAS